jgi:2-dehydro-3-deoxygluconokinase
MTIEVATFGEALGLMLAADGQPLRTARRFTRTVAGAELNLAVGLARLGHRVRWAGRVGDDPFGEDVVATLRAARVEVDAVRIDAAATGLLVRDHDGERRVRVLHHRAHSAGSRLAPEDLAALLDPAPRALHLTGITPALSTSAREATETIADAAVAAGVPVSFDPNMRPRLWSHEEAAPVLRALAGRATIVLAGEDEAAWLTGCDDLAAMGRWFLDRNARVVAIKRGARGAWVTDGATAVDVAPVPVAFPRDPVGAGDAFDAGFLSGWLDGLGAAESAARGAACGAACVRVAGDLDGLPTRGEVDDLLAGRDEVDR